MSIPHIIEETNLSSAWCKVLDHIIKNPGTEISHLVITLTQFEESSTIKNVLNSDLLANQFDQIDTVSETIFPNSLYEYCEHNREALYKTYLCNLPRIKKIDSRNNKGTYFERLIAF